MSQPGVAGLSLSEFLEFVKDENLAVLATVSPDVLPEAALMGVAVSASAEFIFDTPTASRKLTNIRFNDRVAVVIGWRGAISFQIEGSARMVSRDERRHYEKIYESQFPNSRVSNPTFEVVVVTPNWLRRYDATTEPSRCDFADWLED